MRLRIKNTIIFILFALSCESCSNPTHSLPGYIEGEYTYISSAVGGILFNLHAVRGQQVKAGDLLYTLDPEPEKSYVKMLKANIADLQAQVVFRKAQLQRQQALYAKKFASQEILDAAQTELSSKTQQLAADHAQLAQGEWTLQQKTIYAPVYGEIFDTFYRVGERVQASHPVLAILSPKNIKVLFYVPEKWLSQIKLGEKIKFTCDSCEKNISAKIIFISPEAEYTPPVIYSKDTRDKLVFLVRAEMPEDIAKHFHPGQPITVDMSP